jgi:hypothetical protein
MNMFNYIDTPMDKFSDRPDRTIKRHSSKKTGEPFPNEPVLNPAHTPDFGKADRKDR